jgi:hypothetical protein
MYTNFYLISFIEPEKYAFVALPVTDQNIGVGRVCPVAPDLPADTFVQGIVILPSRADALANWLAGTELSGFKVDLRKRTLVMETEIDIQYIRWRN